MSALRLLIVAEDPVSASALRRALRASGGFDVADGYADGRGPCADAALARRPDVVVLDQMSQPDRTLARLRELRAALPAAKLILLSGDMDQGWLADAAATGADAAIARSFRPEGMSVLIREVAAGNVFHAFGTAPARAPRALGPGLASLTRREVEVLRLVAAGAPNSRIAAELWITEQTVKFHLSKVYRKLGVSNRTQASRYAYMQGLVEPVADTGIAA